jgi:hypothetical protein
MSGFHDHPFCPIGCDVSLKQVLLRLRGFFVAPSTSLLEFVRYVLGHVSLIVFGEHSIGTKKARSLHGSLGHDALSFTEEIRQQSGVAHPDVVLQVSYREDDSRRSIVGK